MTGVMGIGIGEESSRVVVEVLEVTELVGRIFPERNAVLVLAPDLTPKWALAQQQDQQRWMMVSSEESSTLSQVQAKRVQWATKVMATSRPSSQGKTLT